jgi:hypothetical protein
VRKEFEVSRPVELDVRLASGDIEIDPTLDGRVEIELIAHDDDARTLVENARVELQDHGGQPKVVVDVPSKRGGFSLALVFGRQGITCRVRCPERSTVAVRTKSADVTCHGTLGGVSVASASGEVELARVDGGLNIKTASGDTSAREVIGTASVQTASGDVEIEVAGGPVSVQSASGDVEIGEAYDNVSVNTVSGDQRHGAVMRGNVSAHSVSGDVTIGVRRGSKAWLDCNTVSGDTSSELELTGDVPASDGPLVEIRAKTVSGDIRITRAPGPGVTAPTNHAQEVHQ